MGVLEYLFLEINVGVPVYSYFMRNPQINVGVPDY